MGEKDLLEVVRAGRTFVYPRDFAACTIPVLSGEYVLPPMPDEPTGALRVLDLGAGVGAFSGFCLERFGPQVQCTCVEPDEELLPLLRRNLPEATAVAGAVSSEPSDEVTIHIGPNASYNTLYPGITTNPTVATRRVRRVDPGALPPCDVLKLDVEGAELDVLWAYPHLAGVWWVALEWHAEQLRRPCEEVLEAKGLHCVWGRWLDMAAGLETWCRTRARVDRGSWSYVLP